MEINACPFCGIKDAELVCGTTDREGVPCCLGCGNCGAQGPWIYVDPKLDAESKTNVATIGWNQRMQL